jgi:uncharacterized protein
MQVDVDHEPDARRYVASIDGEEAGRIDYRLDGGVVTMFHTEVDPRLREQGIASTLVARALDDVRDSGRRVEPRCPFVAGFIRRHPEYGDLVA